MNWSQLLKVGQECSSDGDGDGDDDDDGGGGNNRHLVIYIIPF